MVTAELPKDLDLFMLVELCSGDGLKMAGPMIVTLGEGSAWSLRFPRTDLFQVSSLLGRWS